MRCLLEFSKATLCLMLSLSLCFAGAPFALANENNSTQVQVNLSDDNDEGDEGDATWVNIPMTAIVAREFVEAFVIISNYMTMITKSGSATQDQAHAKKVVMISAAGAALAGTLLMTGVGVGLDQAGKSLNDDAIAISEGVSKTIAAFFIAHLSLKIPKQLGLYNTPKGVDLELAQSVIPAVVALNDKQIGFDVFWNIFRETSEIGAFLIPFFLSGKLKALPGSAGIGLASALTFGAALYVANLKMQPKYLAIFTASLTGLLATGLFSGGMHEFEEAWGETDKVYDLRESIGDGVSHKKLPGAIARPFGYSAAPSVLEMSSWLVFGGVLSSLFVLNHYRLKHQAVPNTAVPLD